MTRSGPSPDAARLDGGVAAGVGKPERPQRPRSRPVEEACARLPDPRPGSGIAPVSDYLTCEVLHDDEAWEQVREAWEPLRAVTPDATPWQRWDFLSGWWRSQRPARRLCLVVVAAAGIPKLILPLQISRASRAVALRWLEPVGMPDDVHRPRLGIGPLDRDAYRVALGRLWGMRQHWDGLRIGEQVKVELIR